MDQSPLRFRVVLCMGHMMCPSVPGSDHWGVGKVKGEKTNSGSKWMSCQDLFWRSFTFLLCLTSQVDVHAGDVRNAVQFVKGRQLMKAKPRTNLCRLPTGATGSSDPDCCGKCHSLSSGSRREGREAGRQREREKDGERDKLRENERVR